MKIITIPVYRDLHRNHNHHHLPKIIQSTISFSEYQLARKKKNGIGMHNEKNSTCVPIRTLGIFAIPVLNQKGAEATTTATGAKPYLESEFALLQTLLLLFHFIQFT